MRGYSTYYTPYQRFAMIKQQFDELTSDIEQISENVCMCFNIYIEFFCVNMGKLSI